MKNKTVQYCNRFLWYFIGAKFNNLPPPSLSGFKTYLLGFSIPKLIALSPSDPYKVIFIYFISFFMKLHILYKHIFYLTIKTKLNFVNIFIHIINVKTNTYCSTDNYLILFLQMFFNLLNIFLSTNRKKKIYKSFLILGFFV